MVVKCLSSYRTTLIPTLFTTIYRHSHIFLFFVHCTLKQPLWSIRFESGSMGSNTVPSCLDLSKAQDPATKSQLLQDLKEVLIHYGGFYIKNFGVPITLINEVHRQSQMFFDLPDAAKLKLDMRNSASFLGYAAVCIAILPGIRLVTLTQSAIAGKRKDRKGDRLSWAIRAVHSGPAPCGAKEETYSNNHI